MKKIVSVILLIVTLFSFSSCNMSEYTMSAEECNQLIEKYFNAVQYGDIETAINLYHKSVIQSQDSSTEEIVNGYLNWLVEVQKQNDVCFDDGFSIVRCKGETTALYDLVKGGGYKKFELDVQIGDDTQNILWVTFEFLKNKDGFGIYDVIM